MALKDFFNDPNHKKNMKWYIAAALAVGMALYAYSGEDEAELGGASLQDPNGISYNDLLEMADDRNISGVALLGDTVLGTTRNGQVYISAVPSKADPLHDFNEQGVSVTNVPIRTSAESSSGGPLSGMAGMLLPMALMIGVWVFIMKRMQPGGGGGNALFGKSKAKLLSEKHGRVTFDDVAGADQAKTDLEEVVGFLSDPHKFSRLGGKIPKGTLLEGPPGTGKTLLARAVAGEAGVPFYTISGSDFVEMYVGVGASRVRDMFEQAKKNAPCIVFIDEIDAVGRHRGQGTGGGNDEREQTLNQLLVEMDGFEANEGVVIMAATNRRDVLDPALLRPGRFDRKIVVPHPDITSREKILTIHARKVPLAPDVNLHDIARITPGFSGADLANLVNEAALLGARLGHKLVTMSDFDNAYDKILMGDENRTLILSEQMQESISYHEAGHAVLASHFYKLGIHDPVYKATRIPRGNALGLVRCVPESDKVSMSKDEYEAQLVMTMAGRAAERIKYGEQKVSSGPQSDIQQASRIARAMVMEFGMSDLGSVYYGDDPRNPYKRTMAPDTQREIDDVVKAMVIKAEKDAYDLMKPKKDDEPAGDLNTQWESIAAGLVAHETLNNSAVMRIMDGKTPFEPAPAPEDFFGPAAPVSVSNDNDDQAIEMPRSGGIPKVPRKPSTPSV